MKKIYIIVALAGLTFGSCTKEKLPQEPASSDPVFYVTASINGQTLKMQAGDNEYYMNASLSQDNNNIYTLRGDLERKNCNNGCGYNFAVLFTDCKISQPGASIVIDSVLSKGPYTMCNKSFWPTEQEISFVPMQPFSGSPQNYTWTIAEGANIISTINSYSISPKLTIGKEYNVTLSFDDGSGSCPMRVHSNKYRPGGPFRAWVSTKGSGQTYSFTAVTDKPGQYTYKWEFGDGSTAEGLDVSHSFGSADVYEVKLLVTNEKNETCEYYYQLNNSGSASCEANFRASFKAPDFSKVLRSVTFLLKDPSGKIYSSADAPQVAGQIVNVTEVSEYSANSNGQRTRKVKMTFNCDLKDDSGQMISVRQGEAVLAVAYQ